jgi:predicted NUDIX family NTP pyrophosphohydrolase
VAARESAGVLLFCDPPAPRLLLVHPGGPYWARRDLGAWSIPKGELEPGEEPRACALRELGEELGPAAPALAAGELIELGSVRQKGGKLVHAWAAEGDVDPERATSNTFVTEWPAGSGTYVEVPEIDRVAWFEPAAARVRIKGPQAVFIDRLEAILSAG